MSCLGNRRVLEHWLALRGNERVPARAHFNPMHLPRVLPRLLMLEPQGPDSALIRSFGSELVQRLGMDLTGMDLMTLYEESQRQGLLELLHVVRDERVIAVGHSRWATPSGFEFVTENLWLPFAGDDGDVTRIMGALHEPEMLPEQMESLGGNVEAAEVLTHRRYFRP